MPTKIVRCPARFHPVSTAVQSCGACLGLSTAAGSCLVLFTYTDKPPFGRPWPLSCLAYTGGRSSSQSALLSCTSELFFLKVSASRITSALYFCFRLLSACSISVVDVPSPSTLRKSIHLFAVVFLCSFRLRLGRSHRSSSFFRFEVLAVLVAAHDGRPPGWRFVCELACPF